MLKYKPIHRKTTAYSCQSLSTEPQIDPWDQAFLYSAGNIWHHFVCAVPSLSNSLLTPANWASSIDAFKRSLVSYGMFLVH